MIKTYINGVDIETQYGAYLGERALVNLLTPAPNKAYLEHKASNRNGKTIYINAYAPTLADERDVTLEFIIKGESQTQMLTRFKALCTALQAGKIELKTSLEANVTYKLYYLSCTQLQSFFNKTAKFSIRFNEPNPKDR